VGVTGNSGVARIKTTKLDKKLNKDCVTYTEDSELNQQYLLHQDQSKTNAK
jgi:hypothetical protein